MIFMKFELIKSNLKQVLTELQTERGFGKKTLQKHLNTNIKYIGCRVFICKILSDISGNFKIQII